MDTNRIMPNIEDFKEVIDTGSYYVDKTLLIKDLIDSRYSPILFTRPRRFGKTLTLSMVETFFSVLTKEPARYFEGTKIAEEGEDYLFHMGRYPVVRLNFKDLIDSNPEDLLSGVYAAIRGEYLKYSALLEDPSFSAYEKELYRATLGGELDQVGYASSVKTLTDFLYKHYGRKAVVLVDEYDQPIDNAYRSGYLKDVIVFFKKLYGSTFKSNSSLFLGILTGVTEIEKNSLSSELNNITVFSVAEKEFSRYFGFTEEEMDALCRDFSLEESRDAIRAYYGGYNVGGTPIYCPWSVLHYAKKGRFGYYWLSTGKNALLDEQLDAFDGDREALLLSLRQGKEEATLLYDTELDRVSDTRNALVNYWLQTGYLTILEFLGEETVRVGFPNREAAHQFALYLQNHILRNAPPSLPETLRQAMMERDEDGIETVFESKLLPALSSFDFGYEANYEALLSGVSALLFDSHVVEKQQTVGKGRCDVLLTPLRKGDPGFVIELKLSKAEREVPSRLRECALKALSQIKEKDYAERLRRLRVSPIVLYGICFGRKRISVASAIEE